MSASPPCSKKLKCDEFHSRNKDSENLSIVKHQNDEEITNSNTLQLDNNVEKLNHNIASQESLSDEETNEEDIRPEDDSFSGTEYLSQGITTIKIVFDTWIQNFSSKVDIQHVLTVQLF